MMVNQVNSAVPKLMHVCVLLLLAAMVSATLTDFNALKTMKEVSLSTFFKITPSIKSWNTVDTPKRFAISSMVVDHSSSGIWFIKSLHEKYSIGWNRTQEHAFSRSPIACNIRFFGVGLEQTLEGFQTGGTGYLTLGFPNGKRVIWNGFDKNETNKLHCYYKTTKDTGSEFLVRSTKIPPTSLAASHNFYLISFSYSQDTPKNLGVAVLCPVSLDDEAGPFLHHRGMDQGQFCRPLAEHTVEIGLHLRPSSYSTGALSTKAVQPVLFRHRTGMRCDGCLVVSCFGHPCRWNESHHHQ
jgi:hypothetical protein